MDLYRIFFNPEKDNGETGVYGISLVDDPANTIHFIAMSKDKKEVKLKAANEEKRLLIGPVLIPNQKIYRDWYEGCEIYFDADTIRLASQEFLKNGYQKNSTINHDGTFIEGVTFVESWLTGKTDKAAEYGFDVPEGTWMVAMKVDSDEIWNEYVKEGNVKGFSIDSFFDIEKVNLSKVINKDKNKETQMKKDKTFREQLLVWLSGEKEINLESADVEGIGTVYADNWELGTVVYKDEAQTEILADATFMIADVTYQTDAEGKLVEPVITEIPVAVESIELAEIKANMEIIMKALNVKSVNLDAATEEVKAIVEDRADELEDVVTEAKDAITLEEAMAKIDELQALIDTMKAEVEKVPAMETQLSQLKAENLQLAKQPASKGLTPIKNVAPVANTKEGRRAALFAQIIK